MREDMLEFLKDLKVDTRFVTIREDSLIIQNPGLSRFTRTKRVQFTEKFRIPALYSPAFHEICQKTTRKISRFKLIKPHEKIIFGFSGGKDSVILANVLEPYTRRSNAEILLVTADLEIDGQRPWGPESEGRDIIGNEAKQLGFDHVFMAYDLDIMDATEELNEMAGKKHKFSPCFACSNIRRELMTGLMEEIGASSIILAHNLDDNSDTILASLLKGEGLSRLELKKEFESSFIQLNDRRIELKASTIIRPLLSVSEELILTAAGELNLQYYRDKLECPFSRERGDSIRSRAHLTIKTMEKDVPNIRELIVSSAQKTLGKNK